jgi:GGDEF domain-containing protein
MTEGVDRYILAACGIGFAGVILLLDMMTPLGVLIPVLYLLLLPILAVFNVRYGALLFAAVTAGLSAVGGVVSPPSIPVSEALVHEALINRLLLAGAIFAAAHFFLRQVALERALHAFQVQDRLTGLATMASFIEALERLAQEGTERPVVAMAVHVCNRQAMIQAGGVAAAEAALVTAATACRSALSQPVAGRYNEATVVVALSDLAAPETGAMAERLRGHLAGQSVLTGAGTAIGLAVDIACTELQPGEPPRAAIERAVMRAINASPS